MTNFECIKQMTVEEMADLIDDITYICFNNFGCESCPIYECTKIEGCNTDVIMEWLESEVDDNA